MYLQKTEIKNKTALVTGAGKGIGKACAIALAEAGANVIILSRTKSDLDKVEKIIKKLKRKCTSYKCDVTDYDELKSVFHKITSLDIVVNNAGTNRPDHFTKIKKEDMDYVVDLNIKAAFHVAQLGSKVMLLSKKRKILGGSIINMSSQLGKVGASKRSVYNMTKFGIEGLTRGMAFELGKYNIRVNSVCPTFVETPMVKAFFKNKKFKKQMLDNIPLGRAAQENDVSTAVAFLAADSSNSITGTSLMVDGGWTAK